MWSLYVSMIVFHSSPSFANLFQPRTTLSDLMIRDMNYLSGRRKNPSGELSHPRPNLERTIDIELELAPHLLRPHISKHSRINGLAKST